MKKLNKGLRILWSLILCVLLIGCGSSKPASNESATASGAMNSQDAAYGVADFDAKEAYDAHEEVANEIAQNQDTSQKLVYTGSLSIETLEYDESVKNMRSLVNQFSGVIESEDETDNAYNWYSTEYKKTRGTKAIYLTVRIPTKDFQNFLEAMGGTGKIINRSTNVENITRQYNSVSTDIESYQIQQRRLLEMLEQAQSVEDMITIESRLSEVERQLRQKENERSVMDTDVELSTVYIEIREVMEFTPEETGWVTTNFWRRLGSTIKSSWTHLIYLIQQVIFFIINVIPYIVVFMPLLYLVNWIIKHFPKEIKMFKRISDFFHDLFKKNKDGNNENKNENKEKNKNKNNKKEEQQ